jgi:hypothetical protein
LLAAVAIFDAIRAMTRAERARTVTSAAPDPAFCRF